MHNVRFRGERHASNEVLLGLFYEEVDQILEDIARVERGMLAFKLQNDYEFGDFISGELRKDYVILRPDGIDWKSYRVRTDSLKEVLVKWLKFRSRNRNGIVKRVTIDAEIL